MHITKKIYCGILWNTILLGLYIGWEAFCNEQEKEKPLFTDNGKLMIQFLKDHQDVPMWKAKDIAEGRYYCRNGE